MQASKSEEIRPSGDGSVGSCTRQDISSLESGIVKEPRAVFNPNKNSISSVEALVITTSPASLLTSKLVCPSCSRCIDNLLPSVFHLLSKMRRSSSDVSMYLSSIESHGLINANWMADAFQWQIGELRKLFDDHANSLEADGLSGSKS